MRCIVDKLLKHKLPITIEAPIMRNKRSYKEFIDSFTEYSLDKLIQGINITNYPMGTPSPDPITIGCSIKNTIGIEVIPHITSSIERRYTLVRLLLSASICEIYDLLVLGGDIRDAYCMTLEEVYDIVNMFRKGVIELGGNKWMTDKVSFCIGGALIPYRANEVQRVEWKLNRGVKFFQTQVVIDKDDLINILKSLNIKMNEIGVKEPIPVLIGLAPFRSSRVLKWIRRMFKKEIKDVNYESYIMELVQEIFEHRDEFNTIHLGIHIIPIEWGRDIYNKIIEFMDNVRNLFK